MGPLWELDGESGPYECRRPMGAQGDFIQAENGFRRGQPQRQGLGDPGPTVARTMMPIGIPMGNPMVIPIRWDISQGIPGIYTKGSLG